jgi:ATP-dependent RNA helicase DBP3
MSAGTKHGRDDGEDQPKQSKKVKTTTSNGENDTVKVKKTKEEKEESRRLKELKREKKRKRKEEKEAKRAQDQQSESSSTSDATDQVNDAEAETAKKEKKKKSKKTKEEKKEKKAKESVTNGVTETEIPPTSGSSSSRYVQTAALSAVPESDIQTFLTAEHITVSDPSSSSSNLRPILSFSQLPQTTLLAKQPFAGFSKPTPIQAASWPYALSGRDVIGVAETGSGKTLAFGVPCVEALYLALAGSPKKSSGRGPASPGAVVVSPTRELAMQTNASVSSLAALVGLSAVCVYGGESKDVQRAQLRQAGGADIVVATPGRLKDFISDGTVSLSQAKFVVLDEADRMLDKGFEEDIRYILSGCPTREHRQTVMFTATWPTSVRGLAEGFMVNPVKITVGGGKARAGGSDGEDGSGESNGTIELQANSRITQKVEVVDPRGKEQRLFQLLRQAQQGKGKNDRILVFCLYKKEAVRVEQFLQSRGIHVASIHGDLKQAQRTQSLEAFKAGTTTVLVATDVAARGLDIPEVKLVINLTVSLSLLPIS